MTANDPAVDLAGALLAEQLQMQIPSLLEWIAPTVERLRERALQCGLCDERRGLKASLALHEALTNAVVHGNLGVSSRLKEQGDDAFARALAERGGDPAFNSRAVAVGVDFDGDRCQWALTDQGAGFDVRSVMRDGDPSEEDLLRPSGRGVVLMRALLDEVRYEAGGRRVLLTLRRPAPKDQRRHVRADVRQRVRVAPVRADGSVDWGAVQEGVSQNLSEGGISLFQKGLARAGRVLVGLEVDGRTLYFPAEVRRCSPAGNGLVELGCRFEAPTPEAAAEPGDAAGVQDAVGAILRRRDNIAQGADQRRAHLRASYTERIELSGPTAADPTSAFARDLSRDGIAFITTGPVTLETKLLTLPLKDGPPLRVRARVVRSAAVAEGIYDVGASFTALAE